MSICLVPGARGPVKGRSVLELKVLCTERVRPQTSVDGLYRGRRQKATADSTATVPSMARHILTIDRSTVSLDEALPRRHKIQAA